MQKSNTDSAGGLYDGLGKTLCVGTPTHLQTIAAAPLTADATNAQVAVIFFPGCECFPHPTSHATGRERLPHLKGSLSPRGGGGVST